MFARIVMNIKNLLVVQVCVLAAFPATSFDRRAVFPSVEIPSHLPGGGEEGLLGSHLAALLAAARQGSRRLRLRGADRPGRR